ncbi:response regulator [Candidatus Zixiibacteriota bacterium]
MSLKLLIADDHQVVREGLRSMLEKHPDFEVVGEASDGKAAVDLSRKLMPDVIIMDVAMPTMDGIDATRQITSKNPDAKIVALTVHPERPFMYEMLRAGAKGYLLKNSGFEELTRAIKTVMSGQTYLSPRVASTMVVDFVQPLNRENKDAKGILTPRETEVLQLLAQEKSTREIATHLRVSVKTIETHRRGIMKKLNINSVAGLTKYAVREGLASL